jgi:hypothetical protein
MVWCGDESVAECGPPEHLENPGETTATAAPERTGIDLEESAGTQTLLPLVKNLNPLPWIS